MPDYTQEGRFFKVVCEGLGADDLLMLSFAGVERISEPYSYRVRFTSMAGALEPKKLLGKHMTVELEAPGGKRYFDGIVRSYGPVGRTSEVETLEAEIVPDFWLRSLSWNCRIFQELSVPKIVEKILKQEKVDFKTELTGTYKPRTYCTQYNETDFSFISRLLEEEGIHYFFDHAKGKNTLILSDKSSSAKPSAPQKDFKVQQLSEGLEEDVIHALRIQTSIHPGKTMVRDYDFENPGTKLEAMSKTVSKLPGLAAYEVYEYPGLYTRSADGRARADLLMERHEAFEFTLNGTSNGRSLEVGRYFTLAEHHAAGDYLLVEVRHEGQNPRDEGDPAGYSNSFRAIPTSVAYRPLRRTPRPVVPGIQTAKVVGPSGEEIYTDKYGRVKVQFPWDREGENNEKSSCWIRVSTHAAGTNWGGVFVPRIGWEVLVTFIGGDPDKPLITGAVYNGTHMPPYDLPANQTQSGVKTRSSKKGEGEHYNELRFEDLKDKEEIYLHAERDLNTHVEHYESRTIGGQRTTVIKGPGKDDDTQEFSESYKIEDGGREETIVKGNDKFTLEEGDQLLTLLKGERKVTVHEKSQTFILKDKDFIVECDMGNIEITAKAGSTTVKAQQKIKLEVGSNSIEISQTGIKIKGMQIEAQADIKAEVKAGAMAKVDGGGMLELKGGIVKIN